MKRTVPIFLIAILFLITGSQAQSPCSTALTASIGSHRAPAQGELWYKFSVEGEDLAQYWVNYDSKTHDKLSVRFYSGDCNRLTPLEGSHIPAIPGDNSVYYIQFTWDGTPHAFDWDLYQYKIIPVSGIEVSPSSVSLELGKSYQLSDLSVQVLPENATSKRYTFTTNNKEKIQLPEDTSYIYSNSYIYAKETGEAKLIFITDEGGFKAEVNVNITAPVGCASATNIQAGANTAQAEREQWFYFTALKTGLYRISHADATPEGDKISVDWKVYEGDCDKLKEHDTNWREIKAEAGKTYRLCLTQYGNTSFDWTLEEPTNLTGFNLTTKQLELKLPDGSYDLRDLGLNFIPTDATDKGVDIIVRDEQVLSLFDDGESIVYKDYISAKNEGTSYVVFITHDGGFKDSCLVSVKNERLTAFRLSVHEKTLYTPYNYGWEEGNNSASPVSSDTLNITSLAPVFYPADASDKTYTVTVRNKNIVKYHEKGSYQDEHLQARREGSTYVVFTTNDGNLKDSVLINVSRKVDGGSPCSTAQIAQIGNNNMPAHENHTEWFVFTPQESGNYATKTNVDKYPIMAMEIYRGSCEELYLIQGERLHGGGLQSGFYAEAGKSYFLKATTFDYNTPGGGTIFAYTWTLAKVSASIQGRVTENDLPAQGVVELYSYRENNLVLQETANIGASGEYSFSNLGIGSHFIKAITADGHLGYYGDVVDGQKASAVSISSSGSLTGKDIHIAAPTTLNRGEALIKGYVYKSQDLRQTLFIRRALSDKKGEAAAKVTVLLQQEGNTLTYTQTNDEGYFEFQGVGTGSYEVVIDIPGLAMEEPGTVEVKDNTQRIELNYEISDTGVEKVESSSIADQNFSPKGIVLYPNPASKFLHIVTNNQSVPVVKIYGLTGILLLQTEANCIDIAGLPSGWYIVDVEGQKFKVLKQE